MAGGPILPYKIHGSLTAEYVHGTPRLSAVCFNNMAIFAFIARQRLILALSNSSFKVVVLLDIR